MGLANSVSTRADPRDDTKYASRLQRGQSLDAVNRSEC